MLIKVNTDSFIESTKIDQYYLDGKTIVFYVSSREYKEIYPSDSFAKSVFERIANTFKDATNDSMLKRSSDKIMLEKLDLFEEFWTRYDKKVNKEDCLKKWKRLSISDMNEAMSMVKSYVNSTPDKKYRKNPATWIYQKGWRNEIIGKDRQDKGTYKAPKFTNVSR